MAWRYSVVAGQFAYSLTLCARGGELALHRGFMLPEDESLHVQVTAGGLAHKPARLFEPCDLLGGHQCIVEATLSRHHGSLGGPWPGGAPTAGDAGLDFWARHASQGEREQPPKFWRALERDARASMNHAKKSRYSAAVCPRCQGMGVIRVKRAKAGKMRAQRVAG